MAIEFLQETEPELPRQEIITSEGGEINLEEQIGAKLSIPRDSIDTVEKQRVDIAGGLSLPHEMPDDVESVSSAILIKTAKEVEFNKGVYVTLQHNASLKTAEDCSYMVFLEASITGSQRESDSSTVYKFKEIKDAEVKFNPGERSGVVKRKSLFSWLKIGRRKRDSQSEGN